MGGFFASDANILLILAIAFELAAIILVLASWARRAKDAAEGYDDELSLTGARSSPAVNDDTAGDDELESTFADEDFVDRRTRARSVESIEPAVCAVEAEGRRTQVGRPAQSRETEARCETQACREVEGETGGAETGTQGEGETETEACCAQAREAQAHAKRKPN